MDDMISRQAAMLRIAKVNPMRFKSLDDFHDACVDCLKELPSAQPEIIRCRDCRWRKDQSGSTAWLPCRAIVTPSDFSCCRAERITNGFD